MNSRVILSLAVLLSHSNTGLAKIVVPVNRAFVKPQVHGHYCRCIPDHKRGDKGVTQILKLQRGGDALVNEYPWYNNQGVVLGWCGEVQGIAVMRVKQDRWWTRRTMDQRVELSFYLQDKLLRSYTTRDLLKLGAEETQIHVDVEELHRETVADFKVVGWQRIGETRTSVFTIKVGDGKEIHFDTLTGNLQ